RSCCSKSRSCSTSWRGAFPRGSTTATSTRAGRITWRASNGYGTASRRRSGSPAERLQPYAVSAYPNLCMPRQVLEDTLTADSIAADTALAASGDGSAFERLYRTHVARVHTLVRRMLDADEADDVTQDVFIRAWQKLSTFRGESAFGTWLHRLAVNVVLARRKSVGVERGRFLSEDAPIDGMSGKPVTPELSMEFEEALARLPEGARQVFVLHDVEGYRHEEIARMLGVVPGTSKSQLHHARMALRRHLDR